MGGGTSSRSVSASSGDGAGAGHRGIARAYTRHTWCHRFCRKMCGKAVTWLVPSGCAPCSERTSQCTLPRGSAATSSAHARALLAKTIDIPKPTAAHDSRSSASRRASAVTLPCTTDVQQCIRGAVHETRRSGSRARPVLSTAERFNGAANSSGAESSETSTSSGASGSPADAGTLTPGPQSARHECLSHLRRQRTPLTSSANGTSLVLDGCRRLRKPCGVDMRS